MIFSEEYFFCTEPKIHTTLHIRLFLFFSILSFFFRRESRSLKMEIIKQSFLAAKVKEEVRELKRGQQHRANLQTQASVHDSSEVIEATPMSSPISFGEDVETPPPPPEVQEKKCNWCHIPFNGRSD